jgi:glycosyltransferase involved in cell wall biosynthesis
MTLLHKKNKKIVIFIPSIEFGGVEKNLYILIEYLQKNFSQIFIVTASKINQKINKKRIKIISPSSNYWNRKSRFLKSMISSFLLFKNFEKSEIIVISFQSNIFSLIVSKLMFWPIIIRLNTSPEKYANNLLKLFLFKYLYKLSNEIIVNSHDFKKNLKRIFNLSSSVILNPFKKKKLQNKKIQFFKNFRGLKIINIARLTDQKDHITLLRSINMIVKNNKLDLRLCIIGRGKNFELLSKYIKDNNLNKSIKLLGYKKNAQEYIKHSDLFILSSKFEGLPNTLIEAQISKVPIISSDCPSGPKEILLNGKLGILFKVGSHEDLCKKILLFNKDKKKYKKQCLLAHKYLKRFDYEINLSKYLKIINKYI